MSARSLQAANEAKTAQASARNVAYARRALTWFRTPAGSRVPASWVDVAEAVRDHPGETWEEIAGRLGPGWTKFSAASRFRRFLVAAGIKSDQPPRFGGV